MLPVGAAADAAMSGASTYPRACSETLAAAPAAAASRDGGGGGDEPDTGVRKAPYDEGAYFVTEPDGRSTTWVVGGRYKLLKVLGQGGFSCVVLAEDTEQGELVALKRVGDVLYSTENAKRVLREVCILRRLRHPNIIQLRDVFVRPSQTGRCFFRNGQLVSASLDLYIAMEYANGGDLFAMRGQLHQNEVHSIVWQLLTAVKHLHDNGVLHRDLKSANVLVAFEDGRRIIKVADFGSARSGLLEQQPLGTGGGEPSGRGNTSVPVTLAPITRHASSRSSLDDLHEATSPGGVPRRRISRQTTLMEDLYLQPSGDAGGGFRAPLTRTVCTPCYRAPEVVMSRGSYSSAMDMWSVGCIFGELLQRVTYIGKSVVPNLKVAPVFSLVSDGMLRTPDVGERFGVASPSCEVVQQELHALFDVVGTPPWASIDAVPMPEWRQYLRKIPARVNRLWRRFNFAGDEAVDLLSRMLTFEATMRCSAEEAMSHEFFSCTDLECHGWFWAGDDKPATAKATAAAAAAHAALAVDAVKAADVALSTPFKTTSTPGGNGAPPCATAAAAAGAAPSKAPDALTGQSSLVHVFMKAADNGPLGTEAASRVATIGDAPARKRARRGASDPLRRFFEIADPSASLAALERELMDVTSRRAGADGCGVAAGGGSDGAGAPSSLACDAASAAGTDALRDMLECECERAACEADKRRGGSPDRGTSGGEMRMPATSMGRRHERWTHFDPDTGIELDASVIGALWRSRRRVCAKGCVLGVVEDAWRIAVKFEGLWRCLLQGHWEVSS
uniref:Protein kinase domain-containing protein n=1 Tax=Chlamydomonas euryale TaxID=1486919 RepID=A0A7R9Z379_9CHLO|mmetsp:Transcript_41765/g.124922  ORF Transcript_41765/g.124922 Transcript_41765/m.124922 type:complete len:788 (+) Transcript_41765:334-2697(+)